jgi:hypothetical protein
MNLPSQLLAQCIEVGRNVVTDAAGNVYVTPGSNICGPFPTAKPTVPVGAPTPMGGYCPTGNCFSTPGDVISRVMEYVFPFAGIALLFVIILSGYQLIMSRGESAKIQAATKRITYGFMGFGILIISYVVVKTLSYILGFDSPI